MTFIVCGFTSRHWLFFGSSHRSFISQHTYIDKKASLKKNVSFKNGACGARTMKDPDAALPGGLCSDVARPAPPRECDLGRRGQASSQPEAECRTLIPSVFTVVLA